MKIFVSENLKNIAKRFYGSPLYVTGGYVRNALMGLPSSDIDICSALRAGEAEKLFEAAGCEINARIKKLGTLKLSLNGENFEYTAFRKEIYGKGHTPEKVEFGGDLTDDARRRDFTVNSIYYDILKDGIVDPLGGLNDINNKKIRAFEPEYVFASDGLRLLRMVRFACELDFEVEKETFAAAKKYNGLIKDISAERILEEFDKILKSDGKYPQIIKSIEPHYRGFLMLKDTGILPYILPEIEHSYGVAQRKDFHKHDVFEHTAQTVKFSDRSIRLAAALHDIGKGICFKEQGNFYGHEITGAEHAAKILGQSDLKCSNKIIEETVFLIRYHMYDLNCKTKENKIKLFIVRNYQYIEKLLLLKQADYSGCGLKSGTAPTVQRWREIIEQMKKDNTPFSLKELKISGLDIKNAGCKDMYISEVLQRLLNDCILNPKLNDKNILIPKAERYIKLTEAEKKL